MDEGGLVLMTHNLPSNRLIGTGHVIFSLLAFISGSSPFVAPLTALCRQRLLFCKVAGLPQPFVVLYKSVIGDGAYDE